MTRLPLRWVTLLPVLAIVALGFAVFAGYIDRVEHANRINDIDEELVRASAGAGQRQRGPASVPAVTADVGRPVELLLNVNGTLDESSPDISPFSPTQLEQLATTRSFATIDSPHYRVWVTPNGPDRVRVTALSLDSTASALAEFRRSLVAGGLVILGLAAVVLWMITGAVLRPIRRLSETASRITDGEIDVTVPPQSGSKEISELAADLDQMLHELRSTIEDRETAASHATEARNDMRRFLADISHELRTPLTALKGYSDLYAQGMLPESADIDRAMARIGSESDRMHRLASDMLQLAGDRPLVEPHDIVDINEVAEKVAADLNAAYPDSDVVLRATTDEVLVHGNSDRLHQVLLNLGSNGCQHGGNGGTITITTETVRHDAIVHVIDDGVGIDLKDQEKVFLPFFRGDSSRQRIGSGGAGLGLSVVRHFVEQHGGTITLDSSLGHGSDFTIRLPLAET